VKTHKTTSARLRQRAEELLLRKPSKTNLKLSEDDLLRLIYELEVHKIELELQNEELVQTRSTAQNLAEKYIELYDFAPIGYLTITKEGAIMELNLCASEMLGKERSQINESQFAFFVTDGTKPIFSHFFSRVFNSKTKETCEIAINSGYKSPFYAQLTGIISLNEKQCLLTIMDVTDQKRAEYELEKWITIFKPKAN